MATNPSLDWSELASDVLSLIYKRLSFANFARARSVCSSWYNVSRSSSPSRVPWLIFKQDRDWKLFDPEEGKIYMTQISRLGLADCRSLATCGNWVLVKDKAHLYIINPFTLEIINDLPPLYNAHGKYLEYCPIHLNYGSSRPVEVENAVFCVDERTNDYLVALTVNTYRGHIRFCMKGDEEWIKLKTCGEFLQEESVDHMVYKDKKLYILTDYGRIKILDFSQDFLREVPIYPCINRHLWSVHGENTKMRLTTSGDVLMIRRVKQDGFYHYVEKANGFLLYKMNSTNEKWEIQDSSEEVPAWDLYDYYWDICDFDSPSLKTSTDYEFLTQTIEHFKDLRGVSNERWLLPCFGYEE